MDSSVLRALLEEVRGGTTNVDTAVERLRDLPFEDLGYARVDHHRAMRTGFPEVVFCQGKTPEQILGIVTSLATRSARILATRISPEAAKAVLAAHPTAQYSTVASLVVLHGPETFVPPGVRGDIVVVTAGTSDIPVAEEAALTAETMGSPVKRITDVGVAGIHRLLNCLPQLHSAAVIIAVAGMEGALPSVVTGLVSCPVVAVPTSVGYGASFGGLSALLTMLNSCATGMGVVNIDNGFGAGYLAHIINKA